MLFVIESISFTSRLRESAEGIPFHRGSHASLPSHGARVCPHHLIRVLGFLLAEYIVLVIDVLFSMLIGPLDCLGRYLRSCSMRGFHSTHIYTCPPRRGQNYIFPLKPADQLETSVGRLRQWYGPNTHLLPNLTRDFEVIGLVATIRRTC